MDEDVKNIIGKGLKLVGQLFDGDPPEQALLTEYEVCQSQSDTLGLQYWTLAGIFIGFTSALLGGLIYGIVSNKDLLNLILYPKQNSRELLLIGLILWLISAAVLVILYFLKGWLKRINHIIRINYYRMRDIEIIFGMKKVWLANTIDEGYECKNWNTEIKEFFDRHKYNVEKKWERPSGTWHCDGIFCTLRFLWTLTLLTGFAVLYFFNYVFMIVALAITIITAFIIWKLKRNLPSELSQKEPKP